MDRRIFIRNIVLGGAAAGLAPKIVFGQNHGPAPVQYPVLGVVEGESPAAITKAAVGMVGGMGRFIKRGDKVVIKPNIGWDRTPELAACTNPEVVKTLVELVLAAGAREAIVIDNTINQAKRCYVRSGILDAVGQTQGKMMYVDEQRIKKMSIKGEWIKEWDIVQDIVEADKIINVPIGKHHSLSRLTMGMKNWLGATGGPRNQFHQGIDHAMVDLAAFFKPTLTVLDAYRILLRNGPQGGRVSDTKLVKTVVAGTDPVAVEAYGAGFFELTPADLPYIKLAHDRGLGTYELEKIRIEKRTV